MTPSAEFEVVVGGGGPAGCAAAITLARRSRSVLLLEAGKYPRQKVCGEFVSAEALPVLETLLGDEAQELIARAPQISRVCLHADGHRIEAAISPAARSITRFHMDHQLWVAAVRAGVEARQGVTVLGVERTGDRFAVRTSRGEFTARRVIDATGRWSRLNADARQGRSRYVGIKAHARGSCSQKAVTLYFSSHGYCGVQPVGRDMLNVCALVEARQVGSIEDVFAIHPDLRRASRDWEVVPPTVTTAPLITGLAAATRNGMLCAGDAAGFIDPFLGDGISLALRSGVLAASCVDQPEAYARGYARRFAPAFRVAKLGSRALALPPMVRRALWSMLRTSPGLLQWFSRTARRAA